MSRLFSTSARTLLTWLGFDKNLLDPTWKGAVEEFAKPGGNAEAVRHLAHLDSFR
jgi:hypothetical protein